MILKKKEFFLLIFLIFLQSCSGGRIGNFLESSFNDLEKTSKNEDLQNNLLNKKDINLEKDLIKITPGLFLKYNSLFNKEELKDYDVLNSSQVDDIYSAILKDSDNLISESIAANISYRLNDTISVDKGIRLIQNISKQVELFDGSGLSRYNLVTPKSIIS